MQITADQVAKFKEEGFLVIDQFLEPELIARLTERIDPLFSGKFETGIYPDEWYWRPGLSLPEATRQMCNAWKSDLTIASVVLSELIGQMTAKLAGWSGARIGQDSLWVKIAGSKEVVFHRGVDFIDYLNPAEIMTCWVALDNTIKDAGTIEYVPGSHKWDTTIRPDEFHAPLRDYRSPMVQAATLAGVKDPEVIQVEIPAGGCIFHHWKTWHGSGKNTNAKKIRRSLAIHTLSSDACFQPTGAGYIYGRYKRINDPSMDESFFLITWTESGYRSKFLKDYCKDALL